MASDEDVRKYLEGVDFPVSTFELVTSVKEQDAPEDVLDRLNQLPSDADLSDPDSVIEQLDRIEEAGKQTPPSPGYVGPRGSGVSLWAQWQQNAGLPLRLILGKPVSNTGHSQKLTGHKKGWGRKRAQPFFGCVFVGSCRANKGGWWRSAT